MHQPCRQPQQQRRSSIRMLTTLSCTVSTAASMRSASGRDVASGPTGAASSGALLLGTALDSWPATVGTPAALPLRHSVSHTTRAAVCLAISTPSASAARLRGSAYAWHSWRDEMRPPCTNVPAGAAAGRSSGMVSRPCSSQACAAALRQHGLPLCRTAGGQRHQCWLLACAGVQAASPRSASHSGCWFTNVAVLPRGSACGPLSRACSISAIVSRQPHPHTRSCCACGASLVP